jgi:predicted SAM-dependent methyltransferase
MQIERKRIIIFTGKAWESWNRESVENGLAGSESWVVYLAEEFVKMHFDVSVYIDFKTSSINEPCIENGVTYRHYSKLLEDIQFLYIDYFISSRSCDIYNNNVHCMNKYVMIHDIWLSSDSKYDTRQWQVKKFAVLSDWHKEFVMHHHKITEDKIAFTINGVNADLWKDVDSIQKKNKIFYSSSLDRGLLELLKIFPILRKNVPDLELVIAYGMHNWEQAIKTRGNQKIEVDHLNEIKELMKQPGINYVGRLSKKELAKQQMECKAWLYPTWFCETFCITAVDAGLAKCAILTTKLAGLITTVDNAGILIDGISSSSQYQEKFIQESIKLLTDEDYRKCWADKAYNKMKDYTWKKAANTWIDIFNDNKNKKLNLGCGGKKMEGYVGVDIFKHENVDEIFSMDNIPYGDASIDGLYSEHALEHLTFKAAERAVKEWYRVLKDGCELILKIPDLQLCCESYLNPPEHILKRGVSFQSAREWFRYTIFGRQMSLSGELDEAQVHKSGYSKQEIRALLENVGFKITSITNYDGWDTPSIEIKAFK